MKISGVTQTLLFEVQMNGKFALMRPFITLDVSE
jgi:hypothetical protein